MNYAHLRLKKKIDFLEIIILGNARQGEIYRQKHLNGKNRRKGKKTLKRCKGHEERE